MGEPFIIALIPTEYLTSIWVMPIYGAIGAWL